MQKRKRLKLPNGFGSIVLMPGGNRRRPYAVKKTIAGKQHVIGYGTDYNEAMAILVNFNSGRTLAGGITFASCFHLWKSEHFKKVSKSTQTSYNAAFRSCLKLHDMPMAMLKLQDLQRVITDMRSRGLGYPSQKKAKVLMMQLYSYAIKNDQLAKDYSVFVELDHYVRKIKKTPFCTRQLNRVRSIVPEEPMASTVLMMCYGGCRISELLHIRSEDVKSAKRAYLIRDSKTAAGRNRWVPIHRSLIPVFENFQKSAQEKRSPWLLSDDQGERLSYSSYLKTWNHIMKLSKCKHTPHECRHTFITMTSAAGCDQLAVKRIVGHSVSDITGGTYTHKSGRELRKVVDRLK